MESYLAELFARSLAVCLLASALVFLLRGAAAAYRHLICVAALAVVTALPAIQLHRPTLALLPPVSAATLRRPAERAPAIRGRAMPAAPAGAALVSSPLSAPPPSEIDPAPPVSAPRPLQRREAASPTAPPAGAILAGFWAVGAGLLLVRLGAALLRLHRIAAASRPATVNGVAILSSSCVETPLTWGIFRHTILLPESIVHGDADVRATALRHEHAHISRRDWAWNLIAEAACIVCWFQPGVWWLRRRMRMESERACDDLVLLSGLSGPDYAGHLLKVLHTAREIEIAPAMAATGRMEERMKHILDSDRPRRGRTALLAASAPLALLLFSSAGLRVAARPADPVASARPNVPPAAVGKPASAPALEPAISANPDTAPSAAPALRSSDTAPEPPGVPAATPPPASSAASSASPRVAPARADEPQAAGADEHIEWGETVDGLQPGLLMKDPAFRADRKLPFNTKVIYQVLIRNRSRRERAFEAQTSDFTGTTPALIPDSDIRLPFGVRDATTKYRTVAVDDLPIAYLGYTVKLRPGEAVLLPEVLSFTVGSSDPDSFPRVEQATPGVNWLVQPIRFRSLAAAEADDELSSATSPYGNGVRLSVRLANGIRVLRLGARRGVASGDARLFAKAPFRIVAASPQKPKIAWGDIQNGIAVGAQIVNRREAYRAGDIIELKGYGRNLTGAPLDITLGNYWKVNYRIQIETAAGKPVYMDRDRANGPTEVAGYLELSLAPNAVQEISGGKLRVAIGEIRQTDPTFGSADTWLETVRLAPGNYHVRLLSWGIFGRGNVEPASGWIPVTIR